MLLELSPQGIEQAELDWGQGGEGDSNRGEAGQGGYSADSPDSTDNPDRSRERVRVMVAMDALNARYGRGTVKLASAGTEQESRIRPAGWQMKQERRTPRYTTHWRELAVVWR